MLLGIDIFAYFAKIKRPIQACVSYDGQVQFSPLIRVSLIRKCSGRGLLGLGRIVSSLHVLHLKTVGLVPRRGCRVENVAHVRAD